MARWHKGLPPRRGSYIFGFKTLNQHDNTVVYWETDRYFDPAKESHPFEHSTFKNDLVAWRSYPKFDKKVERFL